MEVGLVRPPCVLLFAPVSCEGGLLFSSFPTRQFHNWSVVVNMALTSTCTSGARPWLILSKAKQAHPCATPPYSLPRLKNKIHARRYNKTT